MSDIRKTIDDITRLKSVLDGTERFPARDDSGDFKTLLSSIATYISPLITGAFTPVGGYTMIDSIFPNIPALGDNFQAADGALIEDVDSVFYGYRTRNLNGGSVVLTLTWTADAGGAYATVSSTDIPAINIGDWVTGSGIAADSMVMDYNESTGVVTISDVSATGSISSTFTNDGVYIGGGEGSAYDILQGHRSYIGVGTGTPPAGTARFGVYTGASAQAFTGSTATFTAGAINSDPITDGTNGNPRTGKRTQPHTRKLTFIMRVK